MADIAEPKNRWWIWISLAVGVFMTTLDTSIINISLPTIALDLHSDLPSTQWVVLSYMVVLAGLLIPMGRLSDLIGRRRIYVGGLIGFTIGSWMCGIAHSIEMLIAARVFQAVGGAGIMASGPAITAEVFHTHRGKALGLIGSVVSLGTTLGPSVGGWIVQALGWPWIFWINIPVGVVASIFAWCVLANYDTAAATHQKFDLRGAILSSLSLLSLMILLTYGLDFPWQHPVNLSLATVFIFSTWGFFHYAQKVPSPLIEFSLFQDRLITNACVASFLCFIGIAMIFFLVPFYLQIVRHIQPATAGWILITTSMAMLLASPLSGHLSDKMGSRVLAMIGMGVSALGLLLIAQFTTQSGLPQIITGLVLTGLGNGLFQAPNNNQMLGSVPPRHLGMAGGLFAVVRTLGMTFAIALAGFVYVAFRAQFSQAEGFMPAFQWAFGLASLSCLINVFWIGWYRPRLERG